MTGKEYGHQRGPNPADGQTNAAKLHHSKYTAKRFLMQGKPHNIPQLLRELPHWLTFRLEWNSATAHLDKTPVDGARCDDLSTHKTISTALAALQRRHGDVLGFALPEDRSITLIDLDHARNPETGEIAAWAQPILARFAGTYIEISVSGGGFHIWILGTSPDEKGRKKGNIEIYSGGVGHGRMVAVSGVVYDRAPLALAVLQDELNSLYAELFAGKVQQTETARQLASYAPLDMDDEELLMRARNASNGARFRQLFDTGDPSSNGGDDSAADLALCNYLAWWCGSDEARIDRLFRRSALMREKWERADYRAATIGKALDGRTDFYTPKAANVLPRENQDNKTSDPCVDVRDELASALARIRALEAENAGLRASCKRMNAKQRELRAIVEAPGDQVAPSEKLLAIELLFENIWRAHPRDEEGFAEACITTAASKIGMSKSTGIKSFGVLKDMGVFQAKELPPRVTDMGPRSHVAIAPGPMMLCPREWVRPDGPRKHGGVRANAGRKPKCAECGSEEVTERIMVQVVKRKVVETRCKACGSVHTERIGLDILVETRPENHHEIQDDFSAPAKSDTHSAPYTGVEDHIGHHLEFHPVAPTEINLIPPPARPCIRCRAYNWCWTGERWYCGSCQPVPVREHVDAMREALIC